MHIYLNVLYIHITSEYIFRCIYHIYEYISELSFFIFLSLLISWTLDYDLLNHLANANYKILLAAEENIGMIQIKLFP